MKTLTILIHYAQVLFFNKYIPVPIYFTCLLCLILCLSCKRSTPSTPSYPNIIYILADDLGIGDVHAFNPEGKIPTPNLDQLASEGMIFRDAHTTSSVCTPTRYGILTGRYNWRSTMKRGVLGGKSPALIPTNRMTVASLLQSAGYHTAYIGKWHLGWNWAKDSMGNIDYTQPISHNPNDLGFDYAYGHCGSLDMAPYVYVENGRATAIPTDSTVRTGDYHWWRKGLTAPDFDHEDVTPNFFRRGIQYIQEQAHTSNPFFLYLPLPSPHTPILPTTEWRGKSGINPYADFVMMVDDYLGQLMQSVVDAGIAANTLIIFTSDNGCSPQANFDVLAQKGHHPSYHYRGYKADIFEGGHRVPFIANWPGIIAAGTVSDQIICTTDFMATCAELVGYELQDDEGEDSHSMLALLTGAPIAENFRPATIHHSINGSFAIRKGEWKLIMCPGSGGWSFPRPSNQAAIDSLPPIQLYHLANDPAEQHNLQADHPQKVEELQILLTRYIMEGRSTEGAPQQNDGTEKVWEQLWWVEDEVANIGT